ncbi:MAG: hypothetical protein WAK55_17390 [Xanthobacteraceae bacterium]
MGTPIPSPVSVQNWPPNPQPVKITGQAGGPLEVTVTNGAGAAPPANQDVTVTNTPLEVTGSLTVQAPDNQKVTVTNTAAAPVPITGSITVTPPANQNVTVTNTPLPISGSITTTPSGTQNVSVTNASLAVTGAFFPATQPVSGTFWPVTQPVSGSVSVANFPATQPVSGTFWPVTQPVSGSVSVGNFPATQPVSGTVGVNNFPATQPVSGTVTVANTTTTPVFVNNPTGTTLQVDLSQTGANTTPVLVSSAPPTMPPAGGTLIQTVTLGGPWTSTTTSATGRTLLITGLGVGSAQKMYLSFICITGFSLQNSIQWIFQGRANSGSYGGLIRGFGDVYLIFPVPYFFQTANSISQGVFLDCANYSAITASLSWNVTVLGWFIP